MLQRDKLSPQALQQAKEFLRVSKDFQLSLLPTESFHPTTQKLSFLCKDQPEKALKLLKEVEIDALEKLSSQIQLIERLRIDIQDTLHEKGQIFLCGCGSTGRLSLTLEFIWRQTQLPHMRDRLIGFMAGGDYALVRSIENFEDFPEYGERQLLDLKFNENDLLISCTEGGETPFVIGATRKASQIARRKPYFLYCNPDDILSRYVPRSREVIEDPKINKINLTVGPMAISGSTRLQASTILMFAVGMALFCKNDQEMRNWLSEFVQHLRAADTDPLAAFVSREAEIYKQEELCLHRSRHLAITVLTDTTERSPTFSLLPFENPIFGESKPSWTYLMIPETQSAQQAWYTLLSRAPRTLDWPELQNKFGDDSVYGFNFSEFIFSDRKQRTSHKRQYVYSIDKVGDDLKFELEKLRHSWHLPRPILLQHLFAKVWLNLTSCVVMGIMNRYEENIMLWVKASNKKLIDRSIRYIMRLAPARQITNLTYEDTTYAMFETLQNLKSDEAVVLKTLAYLENGR